MHLTRDVETVAIPVFQFGMFSDVDLSFSRRTELRLRRPRPHQRATCSSRSGNGATLTMPRQGDGRRRGRPRSAWSNGRSIDVSDARGTVSDGDAPRHVPQPRASTEGSVVDAIGSAANSRLDRRLAEHLQRLHPQRPHRRQDAEPAAASPLGGANIDLVRRPSANEDTTNPTLLGERYFTQGEPAHPAVRHRRTTSPSLPSVTATAPVPLDDNWQAPPPAGYGRRRRIRRSRARSAASSTVAGNAVVPTLNGERCRGQRSRHHAGCQRAGLLPSQVAAVISALGADLGALTCTGKRQGELHGLHVGRPASTAGSSIAGAVDLVAGQQSGDLDDR